MHVFSATATLAIEARRNSTMSSAYEADINRGREFLDLIAEENVVAKESLIILSEFGI